MDKRATRPSLSQESKEKWMSMPASSPRNNTPEAQAQTQDPFQPLDYFHGGERTKSPPPVALEKAMDPSLAFHLDSSQPGTPAASSTTCLSRSSTLNSFGTIQTQDSDTTLYSHTSSSSDDTVSVPRSSTFPAVRSYPVDLKSFPNGANVRMVELPEFPKSLLYKQQKVLPFPVAGSVPTAQSIPGGERTQASNNQATPSRHLTFPMEKPKTPTRLGDAQSSVAEGDEERTSPETLALGSPLMMSSTDLCYNLFKQEMPTHEPELCSLQAQTDVFVKSRLTTSKRWTIGLIDSEQSGLHCQLGPGASFLSQRRRNLDRKRAMSILRREPERVISLASQHYQEDRERPHNPENIIYPVASTISTSESTMEPEDYRESEHQRRAEEIQESRSPSPILTSEPFAEANRESSSQDSDDDTSFLHEDCSPSNEEDEDFAYDQLVESITNLVLESSCVGNVEERAVPVKLYVHNLLEQIVNHPKPATKSRGLCLPIRNLPMQNSEAPGDAGEADLRGRSQSGNGSSSSGSKRKNKETPSRGRRSLGDGDEDDPDDSLEEVQSNSPQEAKKRKTGRNGGKLSCPFRKRNPLRFNVRSHGSCALNGFADFALLKRHIKTFHQRANGSSSCVRCKKTFPDQAALKHHVMQPESCPLLKPTGDEDPEDGITEEVEQALKERGKVNNVGSWESLWELLFPRDPSERIPDPYHEPPVELDEVQDQCYDEEAVCQFVQQLTINGETPIRDDGFQYIVKTLWDCRDVHSHEHSKERLERDKRFKYTVQNELRKRQCGCQAQQHHPQVVCGPPHGGVAPNSWEQNRLVNPLSLDNDIVLFSDQFPQYNIMQEYGNDFGVHASQIPVPDLTPSSEGPAHHAAPQHAATTFPYKDMLTQNDRPCSAAGGSAGRSSGPSSQSHDSGYQTSPQEHNAAALLHPYQQHQQHADDARPAWDCNSFSTALGGMGPGQHHATVPGQGPLDLCGVGTGPLMPPEECGGAGSNSDEGFSPLTNIQ